MLWIAILAFALLGLQQAQSRHRRGGRIGNQGRFRSKYRHKKQRKISEEKEDQSM
ncbi:MAG: hypothetical protein KTR22_07680 [Flavobacteriaceae bacterium]|nr:hypothetical protein [Flavobacteriaceae bacterium]